MRVDYERAEALHLDQIQRTECSLATTESGRVRHGVAESSYVHRADACKFAPSSAAFWS